jgi:hypothetical protein
MQPTNKPGNVTKCRVLTNSEISSFARFDHFCLRNALLERASGHLKLQKRCTYANGMFVLVKDLDLSIQRMFPLVEDYSIRKLALCEKDFVSTALWQLYPEVLGWL